MDRKLIFDKPPTSYNNTDFFPPSLPKINNAEEIIPDKFLRKELPLPSLGELDVVRHYTNLSRLNFSVDANFYPLGSCTMKYNPKLNEDIAQKNEFLLLHPYQDEKYTQGALEVMYELNRILCEITGMNQFSFQPSAGAHGELTGMLMIKSFHSLNKEKRYKVIIPDSAHGTNPASSAMCGYETVVVKSTPSGLVDIDELRKKTDSTVAAMMLTNPNTLGLFEEQILDISEILHKKGALLYYDGANFNALMGIAKPSLMGFDVIHLNLHKTFSTPHGSGGPGAAAVGVTKKLCDFLPVPVVDKKGNKFYLKYDIKHTIGRVKSFYGNFLVILKAYIYLLRIGRKGIRRVAYNSVLNANYIKEKLKNHYIPASDKKCMHEVVFSCVKQKNRGASALDIAKRLIDFGIHPPTMYFPLIVKEALMVEPTETESKSTLDNFIKVMIEIDKEIDTNIERIKRAPSTTPVGRVNETKAARFPCLRWEKPGE